MGSEVHNCQSNRLVQETMARRMDSSNDNASGNGKNKGKREMTGLITDVLSRYNGSNKKPKLADSEEKTSGVLPVRRSGSFDDKSDNSGDKKLKSSASSGNRPVVVSEETTSTEIQDESDSKKSTEVSIDDYIDIEKAQYTFPERLMELLMNGTVKNAMWWLPGGEAFALVPNTFYDVVLAKYFQGTKFESFTRKLNRWGFKRLSGQGVPRGTIAYYHMLFKKNKPEQIKKMRSGKSSQNMESEAQIVGGAVMPSLNPAATAFPSYLSPQLAQGADATSSLLAQTPGILPAVAAPAAAAPAADTTALLQLLAAQQSRPMAPRQSGLVPPAYLQLPQQQTAQGSSLDTIRQMLVQDQQTTPALTQPLAQPPLAQLGAPPGTGPELRLRRQAELLAFEELRAAHAQEAAKQQVQQQQAQQQAHLRVRLLQMHGAIPTPSVLTGAPASNAAIEEQIRFLLLQRQLNNNGGGARY